MIIHGIAGTYSPFDAATLLYQAQSDKGKAFINPDTREVAVAFRGTPLRTGATPSQYKPGTETYLVCVVKLDSVESLDFLTTANRAKQKVSSHLHASKRPVAITCLDPLEVAMRVAQRFAVSYYSRHPYIKREHRQVIVQVSELATMSNGAILVVGETNRLTDSAILSNPLITAVDGAMSSSELAWRSIYAPIAVMTGVTSLLDVVADHTGVSSEDVYKVMREFRDVVAAAIYDGFALGLSNVSVQVPGFMEIIGEVKRGAPRCRIRIDPSFKRQVFSSVTSPDSIISQDAVVVETDE